MASASKALPDQIALSVSRRGVLNQSPNRPTSAPTPDLFAFFEGQEWRNFAACIDTPTDLFFPERGIPGDKIRDLCFSCPVRLDCLEDSVNAMPKFGWVGGHPKEGRTQIRRLMLNHGFDLETADAIVLADALERVRQRKVEEKDKRFDLEMGEPIIGSHELVAS